MKTKNRIWIYPLLALGFLLMLGSSSKKDQNHPDYASTLNTRGSGNIDRVAICHNPCTPHQKTLVIPIQALAAHLAHGDEIGACATMDVEYVISHSLDPSDPIWVDNYLRVFINGSLVVEVMGGGRCCDPVPPIHFIANSGDMLRIQAQDHDVCYSLESLWLQKAGGSCLTLLTGDIFGSKCGFELPQQIFFDQTFMLP
jgi:hypothetical protein